MTELNTEIIGYAASLFIAMSLLMANVKKLRYVNSIGCILFVIYGLVIGSYPVAVMNFFCLVINTYHLIKLKKSNN